MLHHPEQIHLLVVFIPVAADALERARAVIEGVSLYADLGLGNGDVITLEKGPFFSHRCPSTLS